MIRLKLLLLGALPSGCTHPNKTGPSGWSSNGASAALDDHPDGFTQQDTAASNIDTGPSESTTSNPTDTGRLQDSGSTQSTADTAVPSESPPDTEFGVISGDCGVLSLPETAGRRIHNEIDFGTTVFEPSRLSDGGAEIYADGTLGGSSIHSEVMAFEVLHRCEDAVLVKSETEISYIDPAGKKTDMLVSIDDVSVGVSVTRAYKWGDEVAYTEADARSLLSDKLSDVLLSQANVDASDAWSHSMLHVMVHDASYLPSLERAYTTLPSALVEQTIVWFTVTNGSDEFVY